MVTIQKPHPSFNYVYLCYLYSKRTQFLSFSLLLSLDRLTRPDLFLTSQLSQLSEWRLVFWTRSRGHYGFPNSLSGWKVESALVVHRWGGDTAETGRRGDKNWTAGSRRVKRVFVPQLAADARRDWVTGLQWLSPWPTLARVCGWCLCRALDLWQLGHWNCRQQLTDRYSNYRRSYSSRVTAGWNHWRLQTRDNGHVGIKGVETLESLTDDSKTLRKQIPRSFSWGLWTLQSF